MNIALFADNFFPQVNGVVTAIHNLAEGLARNGHRVLLIVPKYRNVIYPPMHQNIEIVTVRGGPLVFYAGLKMTVPFSKKIYREVKKWNIDVLHFHAPLGLGFQAILISRLLKKPLVGTFHTFFFESEYLKHAKMDYQLFKIGALQWVRFFYNSCDLISAPTPSTARALADNDCRRPMTVISNGIDSSLFPRGVRKKKSFIDHTKPTALFVGRIAYEKNLIALVDIFQMVFEEMSDARLYIVGGGPQFSQLKKYIQKKKLHDYITLTGEIPHTELVESGLYQTADIFVTASKTENQPLTLLESQCNGLPCVGMKAKGIPDMIQDGKNGFLVGVDDLKGFSRRVLKLLKDDALRSKMAQEALKYADQHKLEAVIGQWEQAYKRVIADYKPKARFTRLKKAKAFLFNE